MDCSEAIGKGSKKMCGVWSIFCAEVSWEGKGLYKKRVRKVGEVNIYALNHLGKGRKKGGKCGKVRIGSLAKKF